MTSAILSLLLTAAPCQWEATDLSVGEAVNDAQGRPLFSVSGAFERVLVRARRRARAVRALEAQQIAGLQRDVG